MMERLNKITERLNVRIERYRLSALAQPVNKAQRVNVFGHPFHRHPCPYGSSSLKTHAPKPDRNDRDSRRRQPRVAGSCGSGRSRYP